VCNEAGETNAQRIDRENKERDAAEKARKEAVFAKWGFLLPYLRGPGGFVRSIHEGIRNGSEPRRPCH
jgi:hypothetical protein